MSRPIRALLLAAGLGTRLRPITLHTPKCLVQVAGLPLLGRWLRQLEMAGCEAVLINTHYLADQVEDFLKKWRSPVMQIITTYEPELLGTAGTLLANQSFFEGATGLLIHADNAMEGDLQELLSAHKSRSNQCLLTMLTFCTDNPRSCGIVATDSLGLVIDFHEKVDDPPGNCANGALYAFDASLLDHLSSMSPWPSDFSIEVIPDLLGKIQTWHTDQLYLDIGTPAALTQAQALLSPIL
ncbi:mobA-like NTP transferase domain protein [Synechococcus sp. PROS-9-1]|uniref:nucleotidyltransferase family protein n=1 Tax=Synechococcus sp. PROS-9-1 TaxID=1968775 RepID=UPI0018601196|nr:nucleotidyltransferase family protein [Synechococcus sp. PROS-9-1]QNJ30598.1 mobA-like NTP transferase domain protein [Synechococcus sp. PROS-9-1]